MQNPRYALVAYVRNAVGEFVQDLRKELHPDLPHLPAHLTILPPRCLQGSELSAIETLEDICSRAVRGRVRRGRNLRPGHFYGVYSRSACGVPYARVA